MSFNTRRIIALVMVLLLWTIGGLLAIAFTDSRLAAIAGVVLGVVLGARWWEWYSYLSGLIKAFNKPAHAGGNPGGF